MEIPFSSCVTKCFDLGLCQRSFLPSSLAMLHFRFPVALSALMLMTQKVTSLALDLHEQKTRVEGPRDEEKSPCRKPLLWTLPLWAYLLSFPTLLGGPLCSFNRFQAWVRYSRAPFSVSALWAATQKGLGALALCLLRNVVRGYICPQDDLICCTHWGCVYVIWASALSFRLAYYSCWMLDEALLIGAGLGLELGHNQHASRAGEFLLDTDIWTLETTNRMAVFTRTWNRSTAQWLRRLIFQRFHSHPLLATFAFSAWWHGLHPGQVFGFLCWAVVVEADYRIHHFWGAFAKSRRGRLLYQALSWCHTQLIAAYVMTAVEMRSVEMLQHLVASYHTFFPFVSVLSLLLLAKRRAHGTTIALPLTGTLPVF